MPAARGEPELPRPLSPQRLGAIRKRLLAWYDGHEQPFPWRHARDPYAALVAAVAAQQTQMSRVLQIYERWMAAFPTIQDLAASSDADAIRIGFHCCTRLSRCYEKISRLDCTTITTDLCWNYTDNSHRNHVTKIIFDVLLSQ